MKRYLLPVLIFGFIGSVQAQDPATFRQWGEECFQVINTEFKSALYTHLYKEESIKTDPNGALAFVWPFGIQLKALVWAGKIQDAETAYKQADPIYYCNGYNKATDKYYMAYNATPKSTGDRYYDDNAWIGRTLLDLYKQTNKTEYLDRAKIIFDFCMSGRNSDGGIRWKEEYSDPASTSFNNTSICTTAPVACLSLVLYQTTGERKYLTAGRSLYNVLKTKGWGIGYGSRGYENAVIMEAALLLYETTKDDSQFGSETLQYMNEAKQLAHSMEACYISWQTHRLNETGEWGGHDMTDAYVHMYNIDGNPYWLSVVAGYLSYIHENCRDSKGHYPQSWNADKSKASNFIIHQASAASAFFKMASTPGAQPKVCEPVAIFNLDGWNVDKYGQTGGTWGIGLQPGKYTSNDLKLLGHVNYRFGFNPDLSSVVVSPGYKVILYEADNFTGNKLELTEDVSSLATLAWDNKMRSMEVVSLNSSAETRKNENEISVYPTLFKENVYVQNLQGYTEWMISDTMGRILCSGKTRDTSLTINTSAFSHGICILSIHSEKARVKKILQKR